MRAPAEEALPRRLSVWALWLLAINGMIGAGIFGVPAELQRLAGPASPWMFVLCGLLIAPIVLSFARLASGFSGTGGPILYVGTAFGAHAGFQAGWAYYVARGTAYAANLNLLVTTLAHWWPAAAGPALRIGLMLVLSVAMAWVNVVGARAAMGSLGVLTVLKLAPLVVLALAGLARLDATVFAAAVTPPSTFDLGAAVLLAIYAYVGFESTLVPAGEARDPRRDVPRALLWGLGVAAALYALVQVAAQSLLPGLVDSQRPLVDAGSALAGGAGAAFVTLGIAASVGGNMLGSMFSTARISYRLALDGHLPAWFGRVDVRYGTPANSVWFYGAACFLLAASGTFAWLAVLSVLVRLLLYAGCVAALPRLRRAGVAMLPLPGGRAIPILALAVCAALMTQVSLAAVAATAALLAVGSVLYSIAAWGRRDAL